MNTITATLIITAIGMGLVFVGVLLLWVLMEVIVRVTTGSDKEKGEEEESESKQEAEESVDFRKQHVAAAAVAFALSGRHKAGRRVEQSEGNALSAWQTVRYASRFSRRANLFNRMK